MTTAHGRDMRARRRTTRLVGVLLALAAFLLVQSEEVRAWAHEAGLSMTDGGQDAATVAQTIAAGIERESALDNAPPPAALHIERRGARCVVVEAVEFVPCEAQVAYSRTSTSTFVVVVVSAAGVTETVNGTVG